MTEIERILDQLQRAFSGDAWYGNSLSEILAGVTANKASQRLFPQALNIWELVLHLTFTQEVMRRRIEGEEVSISGSEDFPSVAEANEQAWKSTLEKLEDSHRKLITAIVRLEDANLNDRIAGYDYSKYFLLHGLIQHLVYHAGQIALLKKAIGQRP